MYSSLEFARQNIICVFIILTENHYLDEPNIGQRTNRTFSNSMSKSNINFGKYWQFEAQTESNLHLQLVSFLYK